MLVVVELQFVLDHDESFVDVDLHRLELHHQPIQPDADVSVATARAKRCRLKDRHEHERLQ